MEIEDVFKASARETAQCLNVSRQRVVQLVQEGILSKNPDGKTFDLMDCLDRYIAFCKKGFTDKAWDQMLKAHHMEREIEKLAEKQAKQKQ